jgi:predicted SAM-dependent methyltransferase
MLNRSIKSFLKTVPGVVPAHFVVVQTGRALTNRRAMKSRRKLSDKLAKQIAAAGDQIKINLGAGLTSYDQWISVEFTEVDASNAKDWERYFVPDSISNVLSEHVWEHMTAAQGLEAARLVNKYLKKGGCFRVAIPDRNHPSPEYYDDCKPDPFILGHKVFYDKDQLVELLQSAGFSQVTPVEWWDTAGHFNERPWDDGRGHINRSAHHDPLNVGGVLAYTSLIVDAVK